MKNRRIRRQPAKKIALFMALIISQNLFQAGTLLPVMAEEAGEQQETDDPDAFLIEDDGELLVNKSGADLSELRAAEQAAQETETEAPVPEEDLFPPLNPASADNLQSHLEALTEMESPTGSDGELINARYIRQMMEGYGYTVSEHNFHEGFLNEDGVDIPGLNIIAERGADSQEKRTRDIFIISTHYDSKTAPEAEDPFANDKSGVAVLLEMARILSYEETDTDICFLFLSGEEDGLYGSANFIRSLSEENKNRVVGVLHVEKAGYTPDDPYILETVNGEENWIGNLVRESGRLAEGVSAEEIEIAEGSTETEIIADGRPAVELEPLSEKQENWEYVSDEESSQKSFADAGITALTVCQDVYGKYARQKQILLEEETAGADTEEEQAEGVEVSIAVDGEKLRQITDILAAPVGKIMSEKTDSLLP